MANAALQPTAAARGNRLISQTYTWASELWKEQQEYAKGVSMSSSMHYGEQTKYVTWTFPSSLKRLELVHITDVQFGHVACREDRLNEYIDWILSEPYRYILLGGDLPDAWALWSPGSPFEQNANPQSQCYRLARIFGRVRHRILGSVGGNHERRAIPAFGDLGTLIASFLRIPYSAGQQFIDINFGEHKPFRVFLWHGRGASRTKGAKMNMVCEAMNLSGGANLTLVGHLHDVLMTYSWQVHREKGALKLIKKCGAMSNSFLEYWATYGEVMGMSAGDVMMCRAILEPSGHWETTWR